VLRVFVAHDPVGMAQGDAEDNRLRARG
jgi:hypothetical protein